MRGVNSFVGFVNRCWFGKEPGKYMDYIYQGPVILVLLVSNNTAPVHPLALFSHRLYTQFALTEDLLVVPACRCKLIKKNNLVHTENGFIMKPIFIPHLACWLN